MATLRWLGPGFDFMTAPRSIDRAFEHLFGYGAASLEDGTPTYGLPIDVVETDDAYHLYATVAGVPRESVEVTFEAGMLCLAVKAVAFEVQGNFIRQERPWGNWKRKLELPTDVDSANIAARFENGVLIVHVPKAAKAKPQRIAIGAAAQEIEGRGKAPRPSNGSQSRGADRTPRAVPGSAR
jgi:HSP20 family protein